MKYAVLVLLGLGVMIRSFADEGMWIPILLGEQNEAEMQRMGMKITAEDIYSINSSSLKDAVVIYGRGCTAEIISDEGLILTNHHCGYGWIQRHSTLEHDYLTGGFWAMNKSEEIPCPGLTCTMLVRMEEVTSRVLEGITDDLSEEERKNIIDENIKRIKEEAIEGSDYEARIEPFYYGNQYFLFINEVFKDIRMVGAPPSDIGKFGGDTDNWMWPRHTGDFSLFRIYVNQDNQPAEYSEENIPYTPKQHMKISLKGYKEGDFTFVFGYPGSTQEYVPSYEISLITEVENPVRIKFRTIALNIMGNAMNESDLVRLQYSAKHAGIANGWKKWIGENKGIKRLDAINKKRAFEKDFALWADQNPLTQEKYGGLLPDFDKVYSQLMPLQKATVYLLESAFRIELIQFAMGFRRLVENSQDPAISDNEINQETARLIRQCDNFFKDYNIEIDKEIFSTLLQMYHEELEPDLQPEIIRFAAMKYDNDFREYAEDIYDKSFFSGKEPVITFLQNYKRQQYKKILKDPVYKLSQEVRSYYLEHFLSSVQPLQRQADSLMRTYMKAQMEMQTGHRFYPDANFTLRVTYGKVMDYYPADAVHYEYFTTLSGIMEKEDPDIYDYVVEDGLKKLYNTHDYGRYGDKDGTMHVCFTASNHTTGGNSGSPVLNADGYLIGINFDRNWEGTMSDLMYDPDMCRNISLDIRYCLFIIDKFAGAGHLIDEMTLVE